MPNKKTDMIIDNKGLGSMMLLVLITLVVGSVIFILPYLPDVLSYNSSTAIPGKIQAEDYDSGAHGDAFFDTSPQNSGGHYRNDAVDIEKVAGTSSQYNVGYTYNTEWLRYTLPVEEAGVYKVKFRVARGWSGSAPVDLEIDGNIVATINVGYTGGWQNWSVLEVNNIGMEEGTSTVYLRFRATGVNIDWFEFEKTANLPNEYYAVPGTVEAEDFSNYFDTSAQNSGGQYRNTPVDIEYTSDTTGRYNVAYIYPTEWLEYNIDAQEAGDYTLTLRTARRPAGTGQLKVYLDGVDKGNVSIPSTNGWQTWQNTTGPTLTLSEGQHKIKLLFTQGSFNINYLNLNNTRPGFEVCAGAPTAQNHNVKTADQLVTEFPLAHEENIRYCYNYLIDRAQQTQNDPAFIMAVWIEESWASNYERFPTVIDFGCGSYVNNFDDGLECMLSTQQTYTNPADWRFKCSDIRNPTDKLDVKEFFQIYACGPGSPSNETNCYADPPEFNFECTATNQGGGDWPDRMNSYYRRTHNQGKNIDQSKILPASTWSQ